MDKEEYTEEIIIDKCTGMRTVLKYYDTFTVMEIEQEVPDVIIVGGLTLIKNQFGIYEQATTKDIERLLSSSSQDLLSQ